LDGNKIILKLKVWNKKTKVKVGENYFFLKSKRKWKIKKIKVKECENLKNKK